MKEKHTQKIKVFVQDLIMVALGMEVNLLYIFFFMAAPTAYGSSQGPGIEPPQQPEPLQSDL